MYKQRSGYTGGSRLTASLAAAVAAAGSPLTQGTLPPLSCEAEEDADGYNYSKHSFFYCKCNCFEINL